MRVTTCTFLIALLKNNGGETGGLVTPAHCTHSRMIQFEGDSSDDRQRKIDDVTFLTFIGKLKDGIREHARVHGCRSARVRS